jgi:regulator of protease activity HflC (stomatin/prohibitin superfamily)
MNLTSKHFKTFWLLYFSIGIAVFIFLRLSINTIKDMNFFGEPTSWFGIVSGIFCGSYLAYLIICFERIVTNEIGCILIFGKPLFQVNSGLTFVPKPFYELIRETRLVIEEQYPEDEKANVGEASPIYITHGSSQVFSVDPLDSRITTVVSIVCRYKIVDLTKFITSIGEKEQLRRQIRDIVVTTTQVECSKETVGKNYNRLTEINSKLKSAVENLTSDWGIEVITVLLQNIDLGGAINDALRNVPISIINKEVNKNNAQKIYYEGLAEAEVHKAFQFAKAEGYKIIAKELNIPEPVVIYQIDALTNMWRKNNADVNLYSGDMSEVFKMVTAFTKISNNNKLT